jgi:hypothetical protein
MRWGLIPPWVGFAGKAGGPKHPCSRPIDDLARLRRDSGGPSHFVFSSRMRRKPAPVRREPNRVILLVV